METRIFKTIVWCLVYVFTLPMRNGNLTNVAIATQLFLVFTLPMRNGNMSGRRRWQNKDIVFTLPMRNGNNNNVSMKKRHYSFLPYLWGMETWFVWFCCNNCRLVFTLPMRNGNLCQQQYYHQNCNRFYLTYEEWKQKSFDMVFNTSFVFTLPMRNGNASSISASSVWAAFLPYLWGMETSIKHIPLPPSFCFYLTYEEWKRGTTWNM